MEQVDSTLIFLLSRGPDGYVRQLVPIHVPQHCQGCPKAAPGVALLPTENGLTLPPSPLQNKTRPGPNSGNPSTPQPSPTQARSHQPLTPRGKGHTDTWPPRVES